MRIIRAADRLTPHFRRSELACRCRRESCDAKEMDSSHMQKLEAIRVDWGRPLIVTSGSRCEWWNKRIGGAEHSQHLLGLATDFHFASEEEAQAFAALADEHDFGGIGTGIHLVHIDSRADRHRWTYDDR